jgi:hypothetical protein
MKPVDNVDNLWIIKLEILWPVMGLDCSPWLREKYYEKFLDFLQEFCGPPSNEF